MTTLLVCGSRDLHIPLADMVSYLGLMQSAYHGIDRIIHGGARGVDTVAGLAAETLGLPVTVYPADWDTHGKAAGPKRNQQMLDEGKPVAVLAIRNAGHSPGTDNMIRMARWAGVPVHIVEWGE